MINSHQDNENQPFDIERTVAGGLRAGTWTLNNYQSQDGQSHYIISKLDDNNRILQAKKIETMFFFPSPIPPKGSKAKNNINNTKDKEDEHIKTRNDNDMANQDQTKANDDSKEDDVEIKI